MADGISTRYYSCTVETRPAIRTRRTSRAVAVAPNFKREALVHQRVPASAAVGFDFSVSGNEVSAAEYRILAASASGRLSSIISPLCGPDRRRLDAVCATSLPRMEKAGNELEYGQR